MYYAMFHRVCEGLVECLAELGGDAAATMACNSLYRSVEHEKLTRKCRSNEISKFSADGRKFAQLLVAMRSKREVADYAPLARFSKSEVMNDFLQVTSALESLKNAEPHRHTAFFFFVGLRGKHGSES